MRAIVHRALGVAITCSMAVTACPAGAGDEGGIELIGDHGLDAWRTPTGGWLVAGDARPDPKHPNRLIAEPGSGVLINGPTGKTTNLVSRQDFGDLIYAFVGCDLVGADGIHGERLV